LTGANATPRGAVQWSCFGAPESSVLSFFASPSLISVTGPTVAVPIAPR